MTEMGVYNMDKLSIFHYRVYLYDEEDCIYIQGQIVAEDEDSAREKLYDCYSSDCDFEGVNKDKDIEIDLDYCSPFEFITETTRDYCY